MLIDVIAGTRPNFVKVAAILNALQRCDRLSFRLVHTGQHYDTLMSDVFFDQLLMPKPDVSLNVGSGTQAWQTGEIMTRYEALLLESRSDFCLVVGDVNSTVAATIAARKLGVPVGHVEAGIRSGDMRMPEEINRILTDSICTHFFTTTRLAEENLLRAGVDKTQIFFVGNTMIDTLRAREEDLTPPRLWQYYHLNPKAYVVLTLHRPSNVDNVDQLCVKLQAISAACGEAPIVFPAHPRTQKMLKDKALPCQIQISGPEPYLQFNYLVKHAMAVITDSGGITEEATVFGVPCLTLRDTTERPETISMGTNELIGEDMDRLSGAIHEIQNGNWKSGTIPELWDGRAAERIVDILEQLAAEQSA